MHRAFDLVEQYEEYIIVASMIYLSIHPARMKREVRPKRNEESRTGGFSSSGASLSTYFFHCLLEVSISRSNPWKIGTNERALTLPHALSLRNSNGLPE